jgi:hypothetical protein
VPGDFAARILSPDLIPFEPTYVLWSDAATKHRYIRLPPGKQIDTSDPDHWIFPVGTQFFKEFDQDGIPVETRLVERIGDTGNQFNDYWLGAFVWQPDQSDAIFAVDGQENINGTDHDAPAADRCWNCHVGDKGHALGFSYVQLSEPRAFGADLAMLEARNLLSNPPEEPYHVPGDPVTVAALGYLHANCGHCHNDIGFARPTVDLILRLTHDETTPEMTGAYRTAVNGRLQSFTGRGFDVRISPGHPDKSELVFRISSRVKDIQMPPLATEFVDPGGIMKVTDWISSLAP